MVLLGMVMERCIWYHLAAIYDANFDWRFLALRFGEEVVVGGWRLVP